MRRIAAVVLFDERGRLLLQERDEWAPRNPLTWSPVGGGVEAGEDDLTAATRELAQRAAAKFAAAAQRLALADPESSGSLSERAADLLERLAFRRRPRNRPARRAHPGHRAGSTLAGVLPCRGGDRAVARRRPGGGLGCA